MVHQLDYLILSKHSMIGKIIKKDIFCEKNK